MSLKIVHEDSAALLTEIKADFESFLGREISPADTEMFLVNGLAYREALLRAGINDAARQNLVHYSRGAALEYLGELVGVSRLPAEFAFTTIRFDLIDGHTGVTIPEGLRVQSIDGKAIFSTVEDKIIPPGVLSADILCMANIAGVDGNGYESGKISIILDPQPYLVSALNTEKSYGGSNDESDAALRERIKIAPSSFSVAGPEDAYRFFAKSANAGIADVSVVSPINTGEVHIYVLMNDEQIPTPEVLNQVSELCNNGRVRPISDLVIVEPVEIINYNIAVELVLLPTAKASTAQNAVYTAIENYIDSVKHRIGLDVVVSKIIQLAKTEGVYDVVVTAPTSNIVIEKDQYAKCGSITVTVTGTSDE